MGTVTQWDDPSKSLKNPLIIEKNAMEIHYPLVMSNIAIEHDHRNSEFSHEKWWIFP